MDKIGSGNNASLAGLMAIGAAVLYGISSPVSKLLLVRIPPTLMAALLYLGAGFGMLAVNIVRMANGRERLEAKITKAEFPYLAAMIALDIAAPIFLMFGLTLTTAENASLLNNFEIVATSLIALLVFSEAIGRRMWIAISLITLSSLLLSVQDYRSLSFSIGSVLIAAACLCWGFENNCTRMLSLKDPLQIVVVKGLGSGAGSLLISLSLKEYASDTLYILAALLLGFIAYGLSITFYIKAQRTLGAARTSAFYAAAPFIGVLVSWLVWRETITASFLAALMIMLLGTYFAMTEKHRHSHLHVETTHEHKHGHNEIHHGHPHDAGAPGVHSHVHTHESMEHQHSHTPDAHHRHLH